MYDDSFRRMGFSTSWVEMPQLLRAIESFDGRSLYDDVTRNPYAIGEKVDDFFLRRGVADLDVGVVAVIASDEFGPYAPIVAQCLANVGVVQPNSPLSLRLANDKWVTHQLFRDAGLPVPRAVLVRGHSDVDNAAARLGFPIVVKELEGTQGLGVRLAHDMAELRLCTEELELNRQPLMFEHYIECGAADKRVVTLNHCVFSSMIRHAKKGDFRANIALGGIGEACDVTEYEATIVQRASDVIGLRLAGMDLGIVKEVLPGREYLPAGSPFLIEANPMPGLSGLRDATQEDVSQIIVETLVADLEAIERPVA